MKASLYFSFVFFLGFLFSSCDPNNVDNNSAKNYWEQNSLNRLKIKGKVKTLTSDNGTRITQFDENGFITSMAYSSDGYSNVATYTYSANGQLSKTVTVNSGLTGAPTTTTVNYEYDSSGKYIPISVMHMYEIGLVPNLKAMVSDWGRTDYVFSGDNLLIINTSTSVNVTVKDTSIVKFSGKYPFSSFTDWSFSKDITFADNGMFLTYTEGFQGTGYLNSRIYKYKVDNEYLLLETVNYIDVYGTQSTTTTQIFTYNDHKDITRNEDNNGVQEYDNYVYDAQGNWTSRIHSSQYTGGSKTTDPAETRTILYWADSKTPN